MWAFYRQPMPRWAVAACARGSQGVALRSRAVSPAHPGGLPLESKSPALGGPSGAPGSVPAGAAAVGIVAGAMSGAPRPRRDPMYAAARMPASGRTGRSRGWALTTGSKQTGSLPPGVSSAAPSGMGRSSSSRPIGVHPGSPAYLRERERERPNDNTPYPCRAGRGRWPPDVRQATLMPSSCTTSPTVARTAASISRAARPRHS